MVVEHKPRPATRKSIGNATKKRGRGQPLRGNQSWKTSRPLRAWSRENLLGARTIQGQDLGRRLQDVY